MKETQTEFRDIEPSFFGEGKDFVQNNKTITTGALNKHYVFEIPEEQTEMFGKSTT